MSGSREEEGPGSQATTALSVDLWSLAVVKNGKADHGGRQHVRAKEKHKAQIEDLMIEK